VVFGSKSVCDFIDDDVIEDIVNNCSFIFSLKDILNNFDVFSVQTAKEIISIFNDIFNDIAESEMLADINMYDFDDDPLLLNFDYDSDNELEF